MAVTITSKGQVTIPKGIRDRLKIKAGDKVDFDEENGVVTVRKHFDRAAFDAAIRHYRGTFGDLGGMTVDEYIDEMRGR